MFMFTRLILAAAIAFFLTPTLSLRAQEHPEHPKGGGDKNVSTADISAGIKKNIESESKNDGKFHVTHEGKNLSLELVKVHDDRLSSLGGGKYFACVDMKAADGTTYDVDFFMSGKSGNMKVTETSVHKVNGQPLYNWKEEGGVWKKVAKS